jgi:hypothetical protein
LVSVFTCHFSLAHQTAFPTNQFEKSITTMVVPSLDPARETYLLWHPFSMPTVHGSKHAFAVSSTVGGYFNSAYTFLLQLIVLQVWAIIINVGLLLFYRKESHSYGSVVVSTGVWNSKPSPFDVLKLAGTYWVKFRHSRASLLLVLLFLAFAVLIINYALPILVASTYLSWPRRVRCALLHLRPFN